MKPRLWLLGLVFVAAGTGCTGSVPDPSSKHLLVAHRGSSAYAPEHTLAAYRLALKQNADFVEQDLQITRDGKLICLHDETLERTTNVEERFPERYREVSGAFGKVRAWYARDFDLSEIRQLDAGSWFSSEFAGERVPTFSDAIKLVRGQAGLFPELKAPDAHLDEGWDMVSIVVEQLRRAGLFEPGSDPTTPVYLQSFDASSLKRLRREFQCRLPLVLLIGRGRPEAISQASLQAATAFADGIGPDKSLLRSDPGLARRAHGLRLQLFPYTFSQSRLESEFGDLTAEMQYYLEVLQVDGLFTDNPDLFPRH